jgi:signal transduction histidine kinase
MNKQLQALLLVLLVIALIGGLAGLIYKTQAIDTDAQAQVNEQLRTLKQLDAEWNLDVLRTKLGINKNYDAVANPLKWLLENPDNLLLAAGRVQSANLKPEVEALQAALNSKIDLIERFKTQNSLLKNSLRFLPVAVAQLRAQIAEELQRLVSIPAAEPPPVVTPTAKPAVGKQGKRKQPTPSAAPVSNPPPETAAASQAMAQHLALTQLEDTAETMLTELLKYNLTPEAEVKHQVERALEMLVVQASTQSEAVRGQVEIISNHASTILRQKVREDAVLADLEQVPTVARLDTLTIGYSSDFDAEIKTQEGWRTVLLSYAAGLLLLLAIAGVRLGQSYRALNATNASLEQRVTERTQALSHTLDSLKESQLQLVQSEKMASLGQMVAGIAHEINTPLAYVKGGLEILRDRVGDVGALVDETHALMNLMSQGNDNEAALAEQFSTVSELAAAFVETDAVNELGGLLGDGLHGIAQISEIVSNLKDFSRLDRAKVDQFNVNTGLDSTLTIARNVVKQRTLEKRYGAVPMIICSPSQINQVFLNLVTNACQATSGENGTITLTTYGTETGVAVEVSDNGQGIPPEVLPNIFDPFFTTKKVGEGTGLGLSIVQRIIKEHGGEIKVKSTVGVGTTFTLLLPRQPPQISKNM